MTLTTPPRPGAANKTVNDERAKLASSRPVEHSSHRDGTNSAAISQLVAQGQRLGERMQVLLPIGLIAIALAVLAVAIALGAAQSDQAAAPAAPAAAAAVEPATTVKATPGSYDLEATRYDPATSPVAAGPKTFNLVTEEQRVKVGDNVYDLWTFNGTAPGPALRAVVGDRITINITNAKSAKMAHSVDYHASRMSMGGGNVQVAPGKTGSFTFTAEYPGVFMYHCATPPALQHIGAGMYGMLIVQPKEGFGPKMPEYAILQSELYSSFENMQTNRPGNVVFNGIPSQYATEPIKAKPNSSVRVFFLNAGPNSLSSFHVVGTIFDRSLIDGNPANLTVGQQAVSVPASGGLVTEMKLVGEGRFPIVTHQFNHVAQGAVGMFVTGDGDPLSDGDMPTMPGH